MVYLWVLKLLGANGTFRRQGLDKESYVIGYAPLREILCLQGFSFLFLGGGHCLTLPYPPLSPSFKQRDCGNLSKKKMTPISSYIWMPSHQGVVLFEKIKIKGRGLVQEVCHWGWVLKVQKLMPSPESLSLSLRIRL